MSKDKKAKSKVKQGVWIEKLFRNYITPPCEEYECSVCHKRVFFTEDVCPYCFSEMVDVVVDE